MHILKTFFVSKKKNLTENILRNIKRITVKLYTFSLYRVNKIFYKGLKTNVRILIGIAWITVIPYRKLNLKANLIEDLRVT